MEPDWSALMERHLARLEIEAGIQPKHEPHCWWGECWCNPCDPRLPDPPEVPSGH